VKALVGELDASCSTGCALGDRPARQCAHAPMVRGRTKSNRAGGRAGPLRSRDRGSEPRRGPEAKAEVDERRAHRRRFPVGAAAKHRERLSARGRGGARITPIAVTWAWWRALHTASGDRVDGKRVIAICATQSRPWSRPRDCSPSNAIVPIRRPWLPDQATAAGQSMTVVACKVASSAILSKRSAALAIR
jgi:hypothetical protein